MGIHQRTTVHKNLARKLYFNIFAEVFLAPKKEENIFPFFEMITANSHSQSNCEVNFVFLIISVFVAVTDVGGFEKIIGLVGSFPVVSKVLALSATCSV